MASELWMVQAVIQGFKLDAVIRSLEQVTGFGGVTVSDCRGFGHERLATEEEDRANGGSRTPEAELTDFKPKVRLEIAIASRATADAVAAAIAQAAHTGRGGDGKVFLWPLAKAIRVRNFSVDQAAL